MTAPTNGASNGGALAANGAAAPSPPPRRCRASVAVVGAGQAGLVVARELLREGHGVTVFEAAPSIGGTWVVPPQTEADPLGRDRGAGGRVHSSM
jgi:NADPH-dependent 2,4-dienoyl-CoA reductase/sulfur reductase-like enzyme